MDDNRERAEDVPESDSYLPRDCYESSHDQYNYEEKPLNHKHREKKSKKIKDNVQKINESEHQDEEQISQNSPMLKCKIIQEYANIIKIIKEHNRNLERIKMNRLSTTAQSNLQGPDEQWPEIFTTTTINIPKDSSGWSDQHLENKERRTAGEEAHCSYKNVSKSSNLEGSLYSSPMGPEDLFKGLLDKVISMVTCLNDSKDLNDHIVNLLKRGRDHLKHCSRCGLSSEDCKKLEHICEELRFVFNQKLKQIGNENKNHDHIAPIGRISAGQASYIFSDCFSIAEQDECCCSMIPATCEITASDLWCSEPNEVCCCSYQQGYNPAQDCSLMCEIQSLRKRVRMLEYENAKMKSILNDQQIQANDSKEADINDKQTDEDKIEKDEKDSESSKLLEEERNKLKESLNEQKMLREKLNTAEESLKKVQEELVTTTSRVNQEAEQLKADIEKSQEKSAEIEKLNTVQKQEISNLKNELNEVRKEATALLSKAKERFQKQMATAYDKIRELEEDLARERASNLYTIQENEKCCQKLECALCKLQSSQLKVKKLQACVRTLIDQIRTQKTTTCCAACEKCNRK